MEYRKIISFGKSSFVVSLPKPWVTQNKLGKGDLIYFDEQNNDLVLRPKKNEVLDTGKEIIISVDGKSTVAIRREISSAYVLNYRKIILKGTEIKSKVKELQGAIQHLIALEVMEQTPDAIIASDFLNMDKVSMEELIRKMDVVTRTMLKECADLFKDDQIYTAVSERDKDVDRLYFLLYRCVLYNLQNPTKLMKNFNLSSVDLLRIKFIGYYIETIADEMRRIVRHSKAAKVSGPETNMIEDLLKKMYGYYISTMKAVYNKDVTLALKLSDKKKEFEADIQKFEKSVLKIPHLYKVVNRFDKLVGGVHSLGRLVYTLV